MMLAVVYLLGWGLVALPTAFVRRMAFRKTPKHSATSKSILVVGTVLAADGTHEQTHIQFELKKDVDYSMVVDFLSTPRIMGFSTSAF